MLNYQISSATEMEQAIREVGIIPFIKDAIPGFSIQELTKQGYWIGGEEDSLGPWDWKIECVLSGDIAYGKFLCGGKAAFATIPFYRELANVRRSTTTPDDDGQLIMERVREQGSITIKEVRSLLGVKKSAADAAVSRLMHQCRLLTGSIERIYTGPYQTYKGWQVSTFCTPEALFESDAILQTAHSPEESMQFLLEHISTLTNGSASDKLIQKILK